MKKTISSLLCAVMAVSMLAGCGGNASSTPSSSAAAEPGSAATSEVQSSEAAAQDFSGKTLSIMVSQGWMDNRYDATISRFEDTYGCTVDLQTVPADQYTDLLHSKLDTGTCTDIFWIQSNPFAIESMLVEPEKYCMDFSDASWKDVIPEARLSSCTYDGKLVGLQIWHNSPEYVMLYNKTLFDELGVTAPKTYDELLKVCETISGKGIVPWFIPGADGWQHPLAFFQIGGVYEQAEPGLYEKLNTNKATFAENPLMLKVLEQYKELSDKGYFGEDWIGSDSSNMANDFADRKIAMAMSNSSFIKQIKDETTTKDEFSMFLIPLADNDTFPTNPSGPLMLGYKDSENPELVKTFFDFVCTAESLQEVLDNSPAYTNLHINEDVVKIEQHWLPEEESFMQSVDPAKMATPVLQTGTKYTNDYWMDFGADLIAYCTNQMDAKTVLSNMDTKRAEAAKLAKDPDWAS